MWLKKAAALLAGAAVFSPAISCAATLIMQIEGIRSPQGRLHYAVYDRVENFPTRKGRVATGEPDVTGSSLTIRVPGLKPGRYAVAVFHDENGNDEFDQGFLGIPLEDYAFSNNATGFLSAPAFEDAAFSLTEPQTGIVIRMTD